MIDYGAEIERIASGSPGKVAFRALCALIGRAGNPPELIALCMERVASWPDAEREAPWSWLAAMEAGYSRPGWALARSLAPNSLRCGTADVALPDPRIHPEVRNVARIDIGWFGRDRLAALIETIDHWPGLRSVDACVLTDTDDDLVERFAGLPAAAGLESLCLADVRDGMWHFGKPRFRPAAGRPWRLRHAGLRAPDLVHLLRSGLVPDLRSADVLVCDKEEARDLAGCAETARLERLAIGFRCGRNGRQPLWKPYFGNVIEQDDTACAAFFAHADLAGLRSLTARGNSMGLGREGLGARGVDAITASGVLRQLTGLTLRLLPVDDAVIAGVIGGIGHGRIEKLTLADLVATNLTASAFAAAGDFPIDEYHGARYFSGVPAHMQADIASGSTIRPELAAYLTHLDIEDDDPDPDSVDAGSGESGDPGWESRKDADFRSARAGRHQKYIDEACDFARRMMEGDIGWPPSSTHARQIPLS